MWTIAAKSRMTAQKRLVSTLTELIVKETQCSVQRPHDAERVLETNREYQTFGWKRTLGCQDSTPYRIITRKHAAYSAKAKLEALRMLLVSTENSYIPAITSPHSQKQQSAPAAFCIYRETWKIDWLRNSNRESRVFLLSQKLARQRETAPPTESSLLSREDILSQKRQQSRGLRLCYHAPERDVEAKTEIGCKGKLDELSTIAAERKSCKDVSWSQWRQAVWETEGQTTRLSPERRSTYCRRNTAMPSSITWAWPPILRHHGTRKTLTAYFKPIYCSIALFLSLTLCISRFFTYAAFKKTSNQHHWL
jgi:hypothetical protein